MLAHPLGEPLMLDVVFGWHQQPRPEEQRREDVSLDRVMCDAAEHREAVVLVQVECGGHPRKVVGQGKVTTPYALGPTLGAGCEGERGC